MCHKALFDLTCKFTSCWVQTLFFLTYHWQSLLIWQGIYIYVRNCTSLRVHKIFGTKQGFWELPVGLFGALISVCSQTALLCEENQQSGLSNTQRGTVVLWVLPSVTDKTLNPQATCALNCRRGLWSSCLRCLPGICCSHANTHTHNHMHK